MATEIITEATLCDAVADTFRQVAGLTVQSYNQLTDGIPQVPLLQVYWNAFTEEPFQSAPKMKVIESVDEIQMDLYAAQRSEMREDMLAVIHWMNLIRQKQYEQTPIYYGLKAIKAVSWSARRTNLTYSDPNLTYAGARFTLNVRIY